MFFGGPSFPSGEVVYHKKTSRVYNIHSQCGEERGHSIDGIAGKEELTVTRSLQGRSSTFVQTRDMRSGVEHTSRNRQALQEADDERFEEEWMTQAARYLPPYNGNSSQTIQDSRSRHQLATRADYRPALMDRPSAAHYRN
jgi:hypothetical protein